jgi:chemotaxis protein histidine kinase CheA
MSATSADATDGEIVEIFVEEASEVLESMDRHLAVLRSRPTDRNALGEVRRGFHTLKGSGRMVKALDLGELAWKVENMLNRAMEGKVSINEPMIDLVTACRVAMPKLVDAFKGKRKPGGMDDELESLMSQADVIASGQAPAATAPHPTHAAAGDATGGQFRINELYRRFDRSAQRSDEALHRSEMALQQLRQLVGRIDTIVADSQDRPTRAELNPIIERVNTLTREVMELRQVSKGARPEPAYHPRELQQLIDQRVKERLALAERTKSDMERQIEEVRRNAASARRLGVWTLGIGLSLLVVALVTVLAANF